MSSTAKKDVLAGLDIDAIVKDSVRKDTQSLFHVEEREAAPSVAPGDKTIGESYVAEPKKYSQVTEFLSQKAKEAHTSLYKGYVETLNRVSAELDTASRGEADSKHSAFKDLKLDETCNLNAVWLHELYFANCFDPHGECFMDSMSYLRLERDFGTFEDWQKDFMACAMSAGSGWAICGYNIYLRRYVNTFVCGHSHDVMMGVYPMVVVDMWEHSYVKDYLTDKKSYLIAMMRELNWNVIEERFTKAESIHEVLK
jgi:superoxide dismutase, Fe-Mn family